MGKGPKGPKGLKGRGSRESTNSGAAMHEAVSTASGSNAGRGNHGAPENLTQRRKGAKGGASTPRDIMLSYQATYDADRSRFKGWVASRQIGKSFTSAHEPVVDCYQANQEGRKTDWVTLSAGERQALEWLEKAKQWTEAYKLAIEDIVEDRDSSEALLKSATITWPGGSRIIALPSKPSTARGYSANLTLDEFAFHEDQDAIWRATYPIISNPLRGELKLRVLSTPNGQGNKFHQICTANKKFSIHRTTIHDAVAGGLPIDIEELREGLGDPEGWAQEYECEFLDAAAVLLPYDLIAGCESVEASEVVAPEYWNMQRGSAPVDLGIDFGRKKNLTVCWANEAIGDLRITREVLCLQAMSTPKQVEILSPRIKRARRVCLDYTGPGIGLGDYLVQEFGEWKPDEHKFGKIELCTFTMSLKADMFSKMRMDFERRTPRIPISRAIREDLHSMQRVITPSGNVTYRAPLVDDGHADRCNALALALRAGRIEFAGAFRTAAGIVVPRSAVRRGSYSPRGQS